VKLVLCAIGMYVSCLGVRLNAQCTPQALQVSQQQLSKTLKYLDAQHFPEATVLNSSGTYSPWNSNGPSIWGSGFFPGWIWYGYEQTLDSSLLTRAQQQTASMAAETTDASGHDIGLRIMNSYGAGFNVTHDPAYMRAIQTAAQTMSALYVAFPDGTGTFNSWPYYSQTYTTTIIDNMMSIELMFYAAKNGGSANWYNMAYQHALKAMNQQIRADGSTYQGVEYNANGTVHNYFTSDGFSTDSTWSRGQAWAIYGFTMAYRYTHDAQFLAAAQKAANYFLASLPSDSVPYWDFSKTNYKDSSAGAIAAAGLLELSGYVTASSQSTYSMAALNIQHSLSSSYYQGNPLTTDGILLHGTYSAPANFDIDTSLIWGDYYFLQGCYRAMTPPLPVTGLTAGQVSSSQVPLSWQAQSGAIRYNVKRRTVAGGAYTYIAAPQVLTTNSYVDAGVTAGATYYYVVSASSVAGEGPDSAEVVVTAQAASTDFSVSVSPNVITLPSTGSASSTVTIAALAGFNGPVNLTAGNTAGLNVSFSPAVLNGSGSSTMTVKAQGVAAGTYTVNISATSGALVHSSPLAVTVTAKSCCRPRKGPLTRRWATD